MANHTLTLPVETANGSKINVTISVPQDKITLKEGKIVGGDDDFVSEAIQQKLESSYPTAIGKAPRINQPNRLKYSQSRGGIQGDPSDQDKFSKEHPVLNRISQTLGAPFRHMMGTMENSPEYTEQNTAPEDIGWKRAATGLGDTVSNAFDLLSVPSLIKGIHKPKDVATIAKGIVGYEAGSRGVEAGANAIGVDPSISRDVGMLGGIGGAGIIAGGSPRINSALSKGSAAARNVELSPVGAKVGTGIGATAGGLAAHAAKLPPYVGMTAGAGVGLGVGSLMAKIPPFLQGMSRAEGPWINPNIPGFGPSVIRPGSGPVTPPNAPLHPLQGLPEYGENFTMPNRGGAPPPVQPQPPMQLPAPGQPQLPNAGQQLLL